MVSASSHKPTAEIGRMTFKYELQRSVLLDINCQADVISEFESAVGYQTHLEHLNKCLKFDGCDTIDTAYMIGQ